ncbi:hypothetical protein EWB00_000525 [Schistosoma japonicum]|uniref:Uncharacterized protein n=1 Tax=Schistosoma japonicum TaxID=6182 RepID=A0A4Z2CKY4_SCHJA|nr:hypothetical protein EWB00_000525 [Schistosoma japonicum]
MLALPAENRQLPRTAGGLATDGYAVPQRVIAELSPAGTTCKASSTDTAVETNPRGSGMRERGLSLVDGRPQGAALTGLEQVPHPSNLETLMNRANQLFPGTGLKRTP